MTQTAERHAADAPESRAVKTEIHFVVPTGDKPVTYIPEEGTGETTRVGNYEDRPVTIADGRPAAGSFEIEREGFVFTRHETAVTDFYDADEVRRVYYPEIETLVRKVTGARRVFMFDHTIRAASETTRTARATREPVHIAHNDYTEKSAPQRVRDLLPDEADDLLSRRFAVVQVWRPIKDPVKQQPLAICDAQSIARNNLVETDLIYKDRKGAVLQLAYDPDQRWYYFPDMTRDEAMVFKCYDSLNDGRARFTAHTAFNDPTSTPDAPERVSIEARTLVFY